MKVSTKGRYALRLMVDLAKHCNQGNISLKDISKRENISTKYLEQIVSILVNSHFIIGTRGSMGGYSLIKNPDEYIVGDILRAVEGSMDPVEINNQTNIDEISTKKFWLGLNAKVNEYIDSFTLQDLVDLAIDYTYII